MSAQLEMFGAEPSTDDSPVGLAITLPALQRLSS